MPQVGGLVSETILGILYLLTVDDFFVCSVNMFIVYFLYVSFLSYTWIYFIVFSELYVVKHREYVARLE